MTDDQTFTLIAASLDRIEGKLGDLDTRVTAMERAEAARIAIHKEARRLGDVRNRRLVALTSIVSTVAMVVALVPLVH